MMFLQKVDRLRGIRICGNLPPLETMCQLVPMTDEKFQLEVRNATDKDKQWLLTRRYLNSCTFFKNRIMISRTYNNFYNSIDNVKDLFKKLFGIKKD